MILIQSPDGNEKCLVNSLDGYDGWKVVADDVCEPEPHCVWCEQEGKWKVDEAAKARAELMAIARNPEKLALLLARILARLPKDPE
jgi:hypothetical protein